MSYIYKQTEPTLWTVGHLYSSDGIDQFQPESDHDTIEDAAQRVSYLNGGKSVVELAAPELLEALKGLVRTIDSFSRNVDTTKAEAAIAKAEGKQS